MKRIMLAISLFWAIFFSQVGQSSAPEIPESLLRPRPMVNEVQISVVPSATKVSLGYYSRVIIPGDNLWTIARDFVVPEWMIKKENPELSKILSPGQVIRVPLVAWKEYRGRASWYGPGFDRKLMASGERYDQNQILIAHRHFPIGLSVRVTNLQNGKSVIAQVKDRGPYAETDTREVDLSYGAAKALGSIKSGVVPVKIEPLNTHLAKWVQGFDRLI